MEVPKLEFWVDDSSAIGQDLDLMATDFRSHFKKFKNNFNGIRDQLHKQLESGIKFIFPSHPEYPKVFSRLEEPPWLLSYRGHPVWTKKKGFSIVGSREPSILTLQWLEAQIPQVLLQEDFYIASGGARGVDQCVHRICLRMNRPTVVLVPSGLNSLYPENLKEWQVPVLQTGGALLSEFDWKMPMRKHHFHSRNRLIASLTLATFLVEARTRSGTLITAKYALKMGKPLFILPSHPLDGGARGGLDLLAEGASLIRDAGDLIPLLSSERSLDSIFEEIERESHLF